MSKIFERAQQVGCLRALAEEAMAAPSEAARGFSKSFVDERRGAFQVLLPRSCRGRVLVLGLSDSGIPLALSRWSRAGEVVACNFDFERSRLIAMRAREVGLANLRSIWAGGTVPLPFPDAEFDCVVLDEALRNLPLPDPHSDDRYVEFLRDVKRVLRPNGHLFFAEQNVLSLELLLQSRGKPAEMLGTLVRWFRGHVLRGTVRDPQEPCLFDQRGYRRLLHRAGSSRASFYCLHPDRQSFRTITAPNTRRALVPASPRDLGEKVHTHLRLTPSLCSAFGILAAEGSVQQGWLKELVCHVRSQLSLNEGGGFPPLFLSRAIGASGVIAPIGNDHMLRVPLNPGGATLVQKNYDGLSRARLSQTRLGDLAPLPVLSGEYDGVAFTVDSRIRGRPLNWLAKRYRERAEEEAFQTLRSLAEPVTRERSSADANDFWSANVTEGIQRLFAWTNDDGSAAALQAILAFAEASSDVRIPPCSSHGDYHGTNVLADHRGRIVGVVDWEHWQETRYATHDFLHFLLRRRVLPHGIDRAAALADWLRQRGADPTESRWTREFRDAWDLPEDWAIYAGLVYWVGETAPYIGTAIDLDASWKHRNFAKTLPAFRDLI